MIIPLCRLTLLLSLSSDEDETNHASQSLLSIIPTRLFFHSIVLATVRGNEILCKASTE